MFWSPLVLLLLGLPLVCYGVLSGGVSFAEAASGSLVFGALASALGVIGILSVIVFYARLFWNFRLNMRNPVARRAVETRMDHLD
jgi:hypothetical protein